MSSKVNIKRLQQTNDSARAYKWDVEIQFGSLESEQINLRATTIGVPNPTHTPIDVGVRGFTKKETGAVEWNPITITVIETQDYARLLNLYNLAMTQFDYETGVQANKNDYSPNDTGILILMQELGDAVSKTWHLYGCILETYSQPDFSAEKGGIIEIPFTVHYDYALLK